MNRKQKMAVRISVYAVVAAITAVATVFVYRWWFHSRVYGPLECDFEGEGCTKVTDVSYGSSKYATYDLYMPAGKGVSSLMLMLHGGGFVFGDKADDRLWAQYFAAKGYLVAALNYPLREDSAAWNVELCYRQVEKAVDAVMEDCKKRGYNISNIAVGGRDSGGTLAMLYAYRNRSEAHGMLRFVFQQSAPADFDLDKWNRFTDLAKHEFVRQFADVPSNDMMMGIGEYKLLMDKISPVHYIDSTAVPTLFAYGKFDNFLNSDVRASLNQHLEKFGVKHDFIEYSHSGHRMIDDPKKQREYVEKLLQYAKTYFVKPN